MQFLEKTAVAVVAAVTLAGLVLTLIGTARPGRNPQVSDSVSDGRRSSFLGRR